MRPVAVIPARMGSGRLPGKIMTSIMGKPMLGHLLDRLECCMALGEIVVATSTDPDNDLIESYCNRRNTPVFRGSELDVLNRLLEALNWREAQEGVLVFGDCPLIDPSIVAQLITFFRSHREYDFVSNDLFTTWPPGMEAEVFKVEALADSERRCTNRAVREHGTLYIRQNPTLYRLYNVEAPIHLNRTDLSFEIDEAEDLEVIEEILKAFEGRVNTPLENIIDYMDKNPKIAAHNQNVKRRWKKYRND